MTDNVQKNEVLADAPVPDITTKYLDDFLADIKIATDQEEAQ